MSTIQKNGGTIFIRQNGSDIQYSTASLSWTTISSLPITITNTNPLSTNILTVEFTTNLDITSLNFYFIVNSDYITFDGKDYTCNFNNIPNYLGLIENGNTSFNYIAKNNNIVQNIKTSISGTTTLGNNGGWVCRNSFGYRSTQGVSVINCHSTGDISGSSAGGICGSRTGERCQVTILNCSSSGVVSGGSAGGLCGSNCAGGLNPVIGMIIMDNCFSTGNVTGVGAGGIFGANCAKNEGVVNITNCYSSGIISGQGSGGIFGIYCFDNGGVTTTNFSTIQNCYSSGEISGLNAGGILGSQCVVRSGYVVISGCYSIGKISGSRAGGICGNSCGYLNNSKLEIINCYSSGEISGSGAGGICGRSCGNDSGILKVSGCYSLGNISGNDSGGICGGAVGFNNGSATIENCYSTGQVSGTLAGGICGREGGSAGNLSVSACYITGDVTGESAGGICGGYTGYNGNVNIEGSFSTGLISGYEAGGICGGYTGYNNNGKTVNINISYTTGEISGTRAGGICGGQTQGKTNISVTYTTGAITGQNAGGICGPNASGNTTVNNCFTVGPITGSGAAGILGPSSTVQPTNSYIANGNWSDSTAQSILTGIYPLGTDWYLKEANAPFVLYSTIMSITEVVKGSQDSTAVITGVYLSGVVSVVVNDNIVPESFVIISDTSVSVKLYSKLVLMSVKIANIYGNETIYNLNPPIPICFPAGTPVLTDQGIINIEKINPKIHTINNKKIVAVTKTITNEKHLVCIEKNALGDNIPSQQTIISSCHCVVYKNKFIPARNLKNFIENKEDIYNIKYNNEILYNILMETHETMNINNMIVETLHPENIFAKLYYGNYSKTDIVVDLDDCMEHKKLKNVKKTLKK